MTLPNELHPGFFSAAGGGDLGDPIEQSLRNRGTGQFYRSSFPLKSRWTASFWFKFGRGYRSTGGGGYAFSWHFSGTSYVICGLGIGYPASYTGSSTNGNGLVVCVNGLSTWSDINTSYQIRDSGAWYHHTVTSDNGTLRWYVNGENIGNVTGVKTSGTSVNFTIGGQAQSSSIQGYFADFHFTDGRIISPTEFARYNEDGVWVPKKYEATDYRKNWTDYVTSDTGAWYAATTEPWAMFDDRLTTYVQTNSASGSSTITFTPPTPIPYTSSVEIYYGGSSVSLNGGASQSPTVTQWSSIASGSGTITSIVFTGGYGGTVHGIRVDGVVLTTLYGDDGFHMTFDSSQANGIGHDSSGQGNHFTTSAYNTTAPITQGDVTGTYADATLVRASSGEVATGTGGSPYLVNISPTNALGGQAGTAGLWARIFDGDLTSKTEWYGTQYADNPLTVDFDLRDFTTAGVTSVEICDNYGSTNPRPYDVFLLDSGGTKITGSDWTYNGSLDGQFQTVPVPNGSSPAFIRFRAGDPNEWRILALSGIRVNGTLLIQSVSFNADYDIDYFDTPTSNYALWSPEASIDQTNVNLTDTNLRVGSVSGTNWRPGYLTFGPFECGKPGKYYFEMNDDDGTGYKTCNFGVTNTYKTSWSDFWWNTGDTLSWYPESGTAYRNGGSAFSFGTASTSGGKAMAIDFENGTVDAYNGGTLVGSLTGSSSNLTVGEKYYIVAGTSNSNSTTLPFNFGQMPFTYTPPTGYKALQTNNLPNATIKDSSDHFQAITGSGAAGGSGGRQGLWMPDLFTAPPGSRGQAHTSTDSVFQSGETGKLRAFDGNTATVAETSQSEGRPGWMSFRPSDTTLSGLTATSTFKVKIRRIAELWINGTQMTGDFTTSTGSLFDLSSQLTFPFTLESLEIGAISGQDAGLFGIELDGEYLIQQGILETAQAAFPTGAWLIHSRTDEGNDAQASQWQWLDSTRGGTTAITFPANTSGTSGNHMTTYAAPASDAFAYCWNAISPATNGFQIIQDNSPTTGNNVITHSLGKTPEFIFSKETNNSDYGNIYHTSIGTSGGLTTGGAVEHTNAFRVTSVSSTQFTIADSDSNNPQIHYVWTSVPGFSQFGEYDQATAFVHTGFKPALLWIKKTGVAEGWWTADNKRNDYNPVKIYTGLQQQGTETTSNGDRDIDFLSNGFKIRGTDSQISGAAQYVYMCWAESPFGGGNVPPATAR